MPAQTASPERLIYLAACKMQNPELRREYLDDACGADLALRHRLDSLLNLEFNHGANPLHQALEELGHSPVDNTPDTNTHDKDGRPTVHQIDETVDAKIEISKHPIIGRYKLLEELGRGGMGAVFMAQQSAPVKRKVALKVIKPGMDSREVIARFQAERQALAMMDHPNIARVLDAGTTDEGRPYFVMELVRGIPITKFCEQKKLGLQDRLKLFIDVCKAVQHAHQKAIIHRDLKPSNILVTLHDGEPVVKVIDFGVAKALNQDLTDQTLFTQFSQMIGTPLYMSPEQAEMSGLDVDTRSDVYSLGVVLYELLTGATPIERGSLAKLGYDAVRKLVMEQQPERPSSRVSTLKANADSSVAAAKGQEARIQAKQLNSEVDWIVMKALEKDRTRRYETANGLAADVQRYLDGEAVQACPPSVVYRLRKSFRRNRTVLLTLALTLAGILVGAGLAVWKAIEADSERVTANRQRELADQSFDQSLLAVEQMLTRVASETLFSTPETIRMRRQLLGDAIKFYQNLEKLRPADSRVMHGLATTYVDAGVLDYATEQYEQGLACHDAAVEIRSSLSDLEPENPKRVSELAECMRAKVDMLFRMGQKDEALVLSEKAVKLMENNPDRVEWAYCMQSLASARSRKGQFAAAERIILAALPEVFDIQQQKPTAQKDWERISGLFACLARAQNALGKYSFAEESFGRSIKNARLVHEKQKDPIYSAMGLCRMLGQRGNFYLASNRAELALADFKEAWTFGVESSVKFPAYRGIQPFGDCGKDLVIAYRRLNRMDEAHAFAESFQPTNAIQFYALAMVQRELGDERFVGNLEEAFKGLSDVNSVSEYLGEYHYSQKNWAQVIHYLGPREGVHPGPTEWRKMIHAHFELGQFDAVLEYLQQAWEEREFVEPAFTSIPPKRLATCDDEEFRKDYLKLIEKATEERGHERPELYLVLAAALVIFNDDSEGKTLDADLTQLAELVAADHPQSTLHKLNLDDYRTFLQYALDCCMAKHRDDDMARFFEASRSVFEVVHRSAEGSKDAQAARSANNYAWLLVAYPSQDRWAYELGVATATAAVEIREDGVCLNTLGVGQFRVGEYAAAITSLKRSLELGKSGRIHNALFLSMSYYHLGQIDQAQEWYQKALTWLEGNPGDSELHRFRAEAEQLFESHRDFQAFLGCAARPQALLSNRFAVANVQRQNSRFG